MGLRSRHRRHRVVRLARKDKLFASNGTPASAEQNGAYPAPHKMLSRQLKKLGLDFQQPPSDAEGWQEFLAQVSRAYDEADQHHDLLERSMEASLQELHALHETARQAAETRLEAERDKLQAVIEAVGAGLCTLDVDGGVRSINPEGCRLLRCAEQDLLDTCFFDRVESSWEHAEPAGCADGKIRALVEGAEPYRQHNGSFMRKDGTSLPVSYVLNPVFEGEVLRGAVLIFFDLTPRKQTEQALRASEERYRTLLEHLPLGVYRTTPEGRFVEANAATARLFGVEDAAALQHFNVREFYLDPGERERQKQQLSRQPGTIAEFKLRRPDGQIIWVRDYPRALHDESNEVAFYDGILLDITERKNAEQELVKAREKAEEMSRLKSTFLNNMSHEIRTPLTAIIGFSAILAEEASPLHKELVELIEQSGKRLLNTLNAVLDLSMLEAGGLVIENEWIDLVEVGQEKVAGMKPLAWEKNVELDLVAGPPRLPVYLDRACLDRIMTHLIDNAIKFTEQGSVSVDFVREVEHVRIRIKDTGVGIDAGFQPHLFDEFKQESTGLDRDHDGVGLGLAVTQRMVSLMGGTITVESKKDQGSIFEVAFPQPALTSSLAERPDTHIANRLRPTILVVEDTPEIEMLVEFMLSEYYHVITTPHEEGALALARQQRFDLVLMDINLGGVRTGVDAMQALRLLPEYDSVPVVAMTAYALLEDRTRFLEVGFDGYLSKPFTDQQAIDTIEQLLAANMRS